MSSGNYSIVEYRDEANGVVLNKVITSVSWSRKTGGKCSLTYFNKSGEIYTRARFRAWLKKYYPSMSVEDREAEVLKLPKKVWFL